MLGEESVSAEGVLKVSGDTCGGEKMIETEGSFLKMNCKVLDSAQLKKLDKQEKILAQEIHSTGKGKDVSSNNARDYLPRNEMSLS